MDKHTEKKLGQRRYRHRRAGAQRIPRVRAVWRPKPTAEKPQLHNLPPCVLAHLLSFTVSEGDACCFSHGIGQVCSAWQKAIASPPAWFDVHVTVGRSTMEHFAVCQEAAAAHMVARMRKCRPRHLAFDLRCASCWMKDLGSAGNWRAAFFSSWAKRRADACFRRMQTLIDTVPSGLETLTLRTASACRPESPPRPVAFDSTKLLSNSADSLQRLSLHLDADSVRCLCEGRVVLPRLQWLEVGGCSMLKYLETPCLTQLRVLQPENESRILSWVAFESFSEFLGLFGSQLQVLRLGLGVEASEAEYSSGDALEPCAFRPMRGMPLECLKELECAVSALRHLPRLRSSALEALTISWTCDEQIQDEVKLANSRAFASCLLQHRNHLKRLKVVACSPDVYDGQAFRDVWVDCTTETVFDLPHLQQLDLTQTLAENLRCSCRSSSKWDQSALLGLFCVAGLETLRMRSACLESLMGWLLEDSCCEDGFPGPLRNLGCCLLKSSRDCLATICQFRQLVEGLPSLAEFYIGVMCGSLQGMDMSSLFAGEGFARKLLPHPLPVWADPNGVSYAYVRESE
eukprot:Polyplicarium_translucidae@DN1357_c0_g1_i1.p1